MVVFYWRGSQIDLQITRIPSSRIENVDGNCMRLASNPKKKTKTTSGIEKVKVK